jgi:DNA-directed RNA polymerase subunit N (RpoN/RPB10)
MIIPVRCVTCGKVIANKWKQYSEEVNKIEENTVPKKDGSLPANFEPTFKGEILDKLLIDRICCRRHFLGHVELIDII